MSRLIVVNRTDDIITFQLSNDEEVIAEKIDVINDVPIFLVGADVSIWLVAYDHFKIHKFQEKLGVLLIINRDPRVSTLMRDGDLWQFGFYTTELHAQHIQTYANMRKYLIEHMSYDLEIQVFNMLEEDFED